MQTLLVKIAICFVFYIIGAYATTDILRLLKGSTVSVNAPDCYCPKCNNKIALKDQLPIIAYIKNRGKCFHCKSEIPIWDLFLEVFIFVCMSAISVVLKFSWTAFIVCVIFYEATKLVFVCINGKREIAFSKNLVISFGNNVVIFSFVAFLFLMVQIV